MGAFTNSHCPSESHFKQSDTMSEKPTEQSTVIDEEDVIPEDDSGSVVVTGAEQKGSRELSV